MTKTGIVTSLKAECAKYEFSANLTTLDLAYEKPGNDSAIDRRNAEKIDDKRTSFQRRIKSIVDVFASENQEFAKLFKNNEELKKFFVEMLRLEICNIMFEFKYLKSAEGENWTLTEAATDSVEMLLYALCSSGIRDISTPEVRRITDAFAEMIPR